MSTGCDIGVPVFINAHSAPWNRSYVGEIPGKKWQIFTNLYAGESKKVSNTRSDILGVWSRDGKGSG